MNHYVLPLSFAAAFHGALLFGFNHHSGPRAKSQEQFVGIDISAPPPEEPDIVEPEPADAGLKDLPDVPQPVRQPEPLIIDPGERQPISLPPLPADYTRNSAIIPVTSPRGPGGDGKWRFDVIDGVELDNIPRTR